MEEEAARQWLAPTSPWTHSNKKQAQRMPFCVAVFAIGSNVSTVSSYSCHSSLFPYPSTEMGKVFLVFQHLQERTTTDLARYNRLQLYM